MRYNTLHALGRLAGAAALAAACVLPASAQQFVPLPQSVIVFPFDKPADVDQSVADTVTNGIRNRMSRVTGYEATTFNPKSPLIRRAVSAGELTQTQVAGPFDAASGAAVAMAAGVDNALVGSVESAANEDGTAKVSVSVQLVTARDGQVQKTAGVTGSAPSTAGLAADAQLRAAADDAAAKAVAQIFGSNAGAAADTGTAAAPATPPTTAATGTQPNAAVTGTQPGPTLNIPTAPAGLPSGSIPTEGGRKKKNNTGLIIGGLALLGLIIAAAGNSGGGGGGGGGNNGGGGPPTFPF